MKRNFLFYFFILGCCFINSSSYSQGLEIISNSTISNEISDWTKYKSVRIKTNYNQQKIGKLQFRIYSPEDSVLLFTDATRENDTIETGEEFYLDRIVEFGRVGLFSSFRDYFDSNNCFKSGNYRIVLTFHDTLYEQLIDSVSSNVTIVEDLPSANIFPYCYYPIYTNFLDSITFEWNKPKPSNGCIYTYDFKIIELNNSVLLNLDTVEHLLLSNNNLKYQVVSTTDTFINIPMLSSILQFDKYYAWATRTYCQTDSVRPLKRNNGFSVPFIFKGSTDSTKKLYKKYSCDDISNGFEDGNLDGWIGQSGSFDNLTKKQNKSKAFGHQNLTFKQTGLEQDEHTLVQSTFLDEFGGFQVADVGNGNFALKLGNKFADPLTMTAPFSAHRIRKTFTVTQNSKIIRLKTAVVFDDGHPTDVKDNPFFTVMVYKGNEVSRSVVPNYYTSNQADVTNPYFNKITPSGGTNKAIREWACEAINLENFIGQTMTIEFIVTDCSKHFHFGYAYIDFCGPTDPELSLDMDDVYCGDELVIGHPEETKRLTGWLWTVQKTNEAGTARIGEEYITQWFFKTGALPAFDLTAFLQSKGKSFECNSYYNIKLAGNNGCSGWNEITKKIFISCPGNQAAGLDKCCPNFSCNFQIGSSPTTGYTYLWAPTGCLSNPNIANPYYNPTNCVTMDPVRYTLKVTDTYGCFSYDYVDIYHNSPSNVTLSKTAVGDFCSYQYTVSGNGIQDIEWKDQNGNIIGTNINSILVVPNSSTSKTTYVTVKNPCGTVTLNDVLTPENTFREALVNDPNFILIVPTVIKPNSAFPENRVMKILHMGMVPDAKPAYRATEYTLEILDRWGNVWPVHKNVIMPDGNGFANGDIQWDGKLDGKLVPMGAYHFRLTLYNCAVISENGRNNLTYWTGEKHKEWRCTEYFEKRPLRWFCKHSENVTVYDTITTDYKAIMVVYD